MNIQLIVQLLVLAGEAKTEQELTRQLESLLDAYGVDFYALTQQSKPEQDQASLIFCERWPARWQEIYRDRKYILIDPTVRALSVAQRPYRWRDAVMAYRADPHRQRMQRMMQEAARHGLSDGYVFPIHARAGLLGTLVVGGRFVDLSPAEISLFDAAARKLFWRYLELRGVAPELESATKVETPLTRREMEVIVHLAEGMTSHEIAKSLDISNHTVDWYINGLQEKLKAKNRQHVVALALRLGLVS